MKPLKRITILLILPVLALFLLTLTYHIQPAKAATLTVNTLADETDGCGVGDCSLREAIATVNDGDTIDFSVSGTIDISGNGQLVVSKSLTISTSQPITISGNNAVRVFKVISNTGSTVAVIFNGLTIANGFDSETMDCGPQQSILACGGGGVFVGPYVTMTINNSTLINNWAFRGGGLAKYNVNTANDNLTINNSQIVENSAYFGGGVLIASGFSSDNNISFNNNTISDNSAGVRGGGIFNSDYTSTTTLTMTHNFFSNNSANSGGGGIFNFTNIDGMTTFHLHDNIFSENSASLGGGIYNLAKDLGNANLSSELIER